MLARFLNCDSSRQPAPAFAYETTPLTAFATAWRDLIASTPNGLAGKPCLRGTRLSVEHLLGLLAQVWRTTEILDAFTCLTAEQLRACQKCPIA